MQWTVKRVTIAACSLRSQAPIAPHFPSIDLKVRQEFCRSEFHFRFQRLRSLIENQAEFPDRHIRRSSLHRQLAVFNRGHSREQKAGSEIGGNCNASINARHMASKHRNYNHRNINAPNETLQWTVKRVEFSACSLRSPAQNAPHFPSIEFQVRQLLKRGVRIAPIPRKQSNPLNS